MKMHRLNNNWKKHKYSWLCQWRIRSCQQITPWWGTCRCHKQVVQGRPSTKFWKPGHIGKTVTWLLVEEISLTSCSSSAIVSSVMKCSKTLKHCLWVTFEGRNTKEKNWWKLSYFIFITCAYNCHIIFQGCSTSHCQIQIYYATNYHSYLKLHVLTLIQLYTLAILRDYYITILHLWHI